jgi:hypothetical protein
LAVLVTVPVAACTSFGAESEPPAVGRADAATESAADAAPDAAGGRLYVFVSSVGYADVLTPEAADAKCRAEADGRLAGTFKAWFSAAGVPAPSRLVDGRGNPVDGPWFRVDGKRVAASRAALSNTASVPLEAAPGLTATGKPQSGAVWTATHADGTPGVTCPGAAPTVGSPDQVGPAWTEQGFFVATCGSSLAVYCFQVE